MNSFYGANELNSLGFLKVGHNVLISKKASFYGTDKMTIGDNVRIDDFCILSGKIVMGNYIHIAAYTAIYGGAKGVIIGDYANISSRVSVYAISDDFSGSSMTNPMIPDQYKNLIMEEVIIERHTIIGSGCVILPGVVLREGSAFGALTLINKSSEPWSINAGIPFHKVKDRSKTLLDMEEEFNKMVSYKGFPKN